MNTTRRQVIKTTGVLGTLVSLGIITQAQALAADERPGFSNKSFADAVNALGGSPANSADIILDTPDIAENGAVVTPLSALARIRIGFPIFLLLDCFYQ